MSYSTGGVAASVVKIEDGPFRPVVSIRQDPALKDTPVDHCNIVPVPHTAAVACPAPPRVFVCSPGWQLNPPERSIIVIEEPVLFPVGQVYGRYGLCGEHVLIVGKI